MGFLRSGAYGLSGGLLAFLVAYWLDNVFTNTIITISIMSTLAGVLITLVLRHSARVKHLDKDTLTGCFQRHVAEEWLSRLTRDRRPFTLVLVDINNLKYVNDKLGHDVGDELIKEVADRLLASFGHKLKQRSMVARFSRGDEFVIICERAMDAHEMKEKVHSILSQPHKWGGWAIASAGVARSNNGDAKVTFKCADLAMYRAKAMFYTGRPSETVVYDANIDGPPSVSPTRPVTRLRDRKLA